MKNSEYKKLENFFDEYGIEDFDSIDFCLENIWQKKLFNALDENGEYKFHSPIICHDMDYLFRKKKLGKIVSIKGNRDDYGDKYYVYDFKLILEDGEELRLFFDDRLTLHEITDAIRGDIKRQERFKKSKTITFNDEDIIITDPCYVMREDGKRDYWEECEYGSKMEALGIKNYLTHSTIYGDWSCTTFDSDTKEPIGQFCADAGLVSVFSLNEVREYNPDIDKWIEEHDWCITKIPHFTGEVYIDVEHTEGVYDEDRSYPLEDGTIHTWAKKGEKWENNFVHVIGKGNINFITNQTGL